VRTFEVECRDWSALEEVGECGWGERYYPWVGIDIAGTGCDNITFSDYSYQHLDNETHQRDWF